jgi:hypothetical protein
MSGQENQKWRARHDRDADKGADRPVGYTG